jgi:hypothetical protein
VKHYSVTMDAMKTATITLLALLGLIGISAPADAQRKRVYAYAPYAYVPYDYGALAGPPAQFAYGTYSSGFSPYPYSDGFGAYARSSFGFVPRGHGFYGYGPDPDSVSGYGPYFGSNPWWRALGRFGMDGRPQ